MQTAIKRETACWGDAQLFGDWAIERWHATGTFGAAGMDLRLDLDQDGNPAA